VVACVQELENVMQAFGTPIVCVWQLGPVIVQLMFWKVYVAPFAQDVGLKLEFSHAVQPLARFWPLTEPVCVPLPETLPLHSLMVVE
jgi:hypothetical protein